MNSVPFALDLSVRRIAAALLVTTLALPACGDDGDTTDTDDKTTTAGNTTGGMTNTTNNNTTGTSDDPTTTMGGSTTGTQGELSHAADIQPIWDANCVTACHTTGGSAQTYILFDMDAYGQIVDKPSGSYPALTLVTSGDRDASYLWHKLNGTQVEAGGGGSKMPLAGMLSADDLEKVGSWIDQGAKP
jgi:hypothetical protein